MGNSERRKKKGSRVEQAGCMGREVATVGWRVLRMAQSLLLSAHSVRKWHFDAVFLTFAFRFLFASKSDTLLESWPRCSQWSRSERAASRAMTRNAGRPPTSKDLFSCFQEQGPQKRASLQSGSATLC